MYIQVVPSSRLENEVFPCHSDSRRKVGEMKAKTISNSVLCYAIPAGGGEGRVGGGVNRTHRQNTGAILHPFSKRLWMTVLFGSSYQSLRDMVTLWSPADRELCPQ